MKRKNGVVEPGQVWWKFKPGIMAIVFKVQGDRARVLQLKPACPSARWRGMVFGQGLKYSRRWVKIETLLRDYERILSGR